MVDLPDLDYEMEESEIRHRLSELHDSLILHILSFLPMTDAVSTTIISKRWKNLWTKIPCLNFIHYMDNDDEDESYHYTKIRNFINRALIFWNGTKIQKFKIYFEFDIDIELSYDIDLWVRFAEENEVEELYIYLECTHLSCDDSVYCAPQCIYSCSSLKKLSLVGCKLQVNRSVHWNQLKSLRMHDICLSEHVIDKVLYGCPQLEVFELCLHERYNFMNIQSNSLKILSIEEYIVNRPQTNMVLRIWCPNLEILNMSGIFHPKCIEMNTSLLKNVTLRFGDGFACFYEHEFSWKKSFGDTLSQLFPSIQHVKRVTLSSWCFNVLGTMNKKYFCMPLLSVESLELEVGCIEIDKIVNVLGIFPKLKMLVIKHTGDKTSEVPLKFFGSLPEFFLLQPRKVEITSCLRGNSIFLFVEFLLEHASTLEKMVFRPQRGVPISPESLLLVTERLLSIPRSSPTAKVIFCRR